MKAIIAVISMLALEATRADAQSVDGVFSWMKNNGVSVRRTFDGAKGEGQPASLYLVESNDSSDASYYLVDVALKLLELEVFPSSERSLLLYPVAEWHRSTQEDKVTDNFSTAAKAEIRPFLLRMLPGAGESRSSRGLAVAPTLVLEGRRYWDEVADSNSTRLALAVFPTSNIPGYPGSDIRNASGAFRARYYPYLGLEHWSSDGLFGGENALFTTLRLYLEWVPIGSLTREYVEILGDFTRRWRAGDDDLVPGAMSMLTGSATVYPNGTRQVGIGVDYSKGRDPSKSFANIDRWTLGLKVKF